MILLILINLGMLIKKGPIDMPDLRGLPQQLIIKITETETI